MRPPRRFGESSSKAYRSCRGQSPVFEFLPGYPNTDPRRASSFRQTLEELSAFQAEVLAARSLPGPACGAKAVELRDRFYNGAPIQAVVALELLYLIRDCTDWKTTLEFIDSLPAELQQQPLVREQRALAQSMDGDHHAAIGALRALIDLAGDTSERRGLLGGRYKRLYAAEQDPARKAGYLDQAIAEYEAGMQLDLNDYYPSSNLARLYRTRNDEDDEQKAPVAAAVTAVACERARAKSGKDPWLKPTLLGAAFDTGDVARAKQLAKEVGREGAAAWELETTLADCKTVTQVHPEPPRSKLLDIVGQLEALLPTKAATSGK